MALRSVVLAPPPGAGGPRRTVVLRPGGPKDKGKAADLVTLVIGVLLLLGCIVLAQWLPDKEYTLPQFQVSFPDAPQAENPSQSFEFTKDEAGRHHDFVYELPDNAHSVLVVMFFRDDDRTGSLPDQFRVELFDPSGAPVGPRTDLFSSDPLYNDSLPGPPTYTPGFSNSRLSIPLGLHPEDQIVQGLSHLEVAEQVRARVAPQNFLPTAGMWTVRVSLVNAGDCPASPGASDTQPQQFLYCRTPPGETPNDGVDPGNLFAIENFIVNSYTVQVEELS